MSAADPLDLDAFVTEQEALLALERAAEIDEAARLRAELTPDELERRGIVLRRLHLVETTVGLGGRTVLELEAAAAGRADLPPHRITPGDVVALSAARGDGAQLATGVVESVRPDRLRIALDDEAAGVELPPLLRLDRVAADVTYRRMRAALRTLRGGRGGADPSLRDVLTGRREPEFGEGPAVGDVDFLAAELDPSQRAAVATALRARHVALVHGPPGTGKTTTVVEIVRQAVRRGERVLACAASNVAVDNLVERLAAAGIDVLRLGHPARLLPGAREHGLDARLEAAIDRRVLRDLRREIDALQRRLARAGRAERRSLRADLQARRGELRDIERAALRGLLDGAEVVLATLTGAADARLGDGGSGRNFDLVVIDEAAQALEAACWIALHRGRRAVLAGDHRQLPPTVVSPEAARRGLDRTLFDRLDARFRGVATAMLTVQYRMHATIMDWASAAMYGGRLAAAPAVAGHLLADLPGVAATAETTLAMLWIDTAGCDLEETAGDDDGSKANPGEARLVRDHVQRLLDAGVAGTDIGVIAPYNAQVRELRDVLAGVDGVEVGTVDGFQGREKEAVVLSLVRSNERGEIGFLADARRLNVAVTRARRHAAVVGDTATLAGDAFLRGLIEHVQQHGTYRSAWELL